MNRWIRPVSLQVILIVIFVNGAFFSGVSGLNSNKAPAKSHSKNDDHRWNELGDNAKNLVSNADIYQAINYLIDLVEYIAVRVNKMGSKPAGRIEPDLDWQNPASWNVMLPPSAQTCPRCLPFFSNPNNPDSTRFAPDFNPPPFQPDDRIDYKQTAFPIRPQQNANNYPMYPYAPVSPPPYSGEYQYAPYTNEVQIPNNLFEMFPMMPQQMSQYPQERPQSPYPSSIFPNWLQFDSYTDGGDDNKPQNNPDDTNETNFPKLPDDFQSYPPKDRRKPGKLNSYSDGGDDNKPKNDQEDTNEVNFPKLPDDFQSYPPKDRRRPKKLNSYSDGGDDNKPKNDQEDTNEVNFPKLPDDFQSYPPKDRRRPKKLDSYTDGGDDNQPTNNPDNTNETNFPKLPDDFQSYPPKDRKRPGKHVPLQRMSGLYWPWHQNPKFPRPETSYKSPMDDRIEGLWFIRNNEAPKLS